MGLKVELLGLCGVGKTTFLSALTSRSEFDLDLALVYPVVPPRSRTLRSLIRILLVGFFTEPLTFSRFITNISNWWLIKKIAYRSAGISLRDDERAIFVDSGILQPFLSFEIEEKLSDSTIPVHSLLNGCPLPDLVVVFSVLPRIAKQRYEQRGLCGEGKLIRQNSEEYFSRAEELRKKLVDYCKEKNVQIIRVDASCQFTEEYLRCKLVEIQNVFNTREDTL